MASPNARRLIAVLLGFAAVATVYYFLYLRHPDQPQTPFVAAPKPAETPSAVRLETAAPNANQALGAIVGTVRWTDTQTPAPGIRVIAEARGLPALETTSDDRGGYLFGEVRPDTDYTLRVSGDPGPFAVTERTVRVAADSVLENQDIVVWPGATISGRAVRLDPAVDIRDGTPLPSDAISLTRMLEAAPFERPLPGVRVAIARVEASEDQRNEIELITDTDGWFTFNPMPAGEYYVKAYRPAEAVVSKQYGRERFRVAVAPDAAPPAPLVFRFSFDSLAVQGRVLDDLGKPIAGALVRAQPLPGTDINGHTRHETIEGKTDVDGMYTLDGLASGALEGAVRYAYSGRADGNAYYIIARAEGFAAQQVLVPTVTKPMHAAVQGYVREMEKHQNPQAPMYPFPNPIPESKGHTILVPDLKLEREASIAGRVEDTNGKRLGNVSVKPNHSPRNYQPEPLKPETFSDLESFMTDAKGQFRARGLPAGAYTFRVSGSAPSTDEPVTNPVLRLQPGDVLDDLVFTINAPNLRGSIRGHVIDAVTSKPVEKFAVKIEHLATAPDDRGPAYSTPSTEGLPPGEFVIPILSAGRTELRIAAEGFPTHSVAVDVQAGVESELTIALKHAAKIEGYVTRDGHGITGAEVTVSRSDGTSRNTPRGTPVSTEGHYLLEDFEPAEYEIRVKFPSGMGNGSRYERATVQLAPGETKRVDFEITGNGRIEGTLTLGPSFESGYVWVRYARETAPMIVDGNFVQGSVFSAAVRVEGSGPYALYGLEPGFYTVIGAGARTKKIPNGTTMTKEYITVETRITVRDDNPVRVDLAVP